MTDGAPDGTRLGLRDALARLGLSLLSLLRTRAELATLEYHEERDRLVERLVLILVAVLFLAFAVLAASALVVVWFWDTHRVAAMCGVMAVYLLIGIGALWRLRASQRDAAPPFAATLAELDRDRAWLAGRSAPEQ